MLQPLQIVGDVAVLAERHGLLCLDFTNTAGGHTKIREVERIPTYADALSWGVAAEALAPAEAKALLYLAKAHPKEAARRVHDLHVHREALHRAVVAIAHQETPAAPDFAKVRGIIAKSLSVAALGDDDSGFVWSVDPATGGLGTVLARVALSAHHMFAREKPSQLRQCEVCTWLFIDRTKNQKRRFCRQDACGNKARARRFYERQREI